MLETIDLVQCSKADDFDAHLVCPEDGELDLAVDALLRRRDEVLQLDSDNKRDAYAICFPVINTAGRV